MAAYNFKLQFVPAIRAGTKKHTIRAERKDGRVPKVGEPLALYSGMRTKQCFRILAANPHCTKVERITIEDLGHSSEGDYGTLVCIDGQPLDRSECQALARADGFPDFGRMMLFWRGRLPFTGNIIHWR